MISLEDLRVRHHFDDPDKPTLYAKEIYLPAGHCATTHVHRHAHFSFLAEGRIRLEVDDVASLHFAPDLIVIKAGKKHKITAISDVLWFCIHATGETDVTKMDEVLIKGN